MHLPLLLNTQFQVFRTFSVPTKGPSGYSYILPQQDVLLTTLSRDQTTYLTKYELNSCFVAQADQFICRTHNPIFISHTKEFDCELSLLKSSRTIPSSCVIKQAVTSDYWIQLNQNDYIFVLDQPQSIDVICYDNLTSLHVQDTGIVSIPPKCQLRSQNLIINSGNKDRTSKHTSFIPSLNISGIPFKIEFNPQAVSQTPFLLKLNDSHGLPDLGHQIKNLKEFQLSEPDFKLHFVNNNHIYFTIFLIISFILTLFCCVRLGFHWHNKGSRFFIPSISPKDDPPHPFPEQEIKPQIPSRNLKPEYTELQEK